VHEALILEAVARSSMNSAQAVHRRMTKGVNSLATIASIAPLLGFIGTFVGVVNTFLGITGEAWAYEAATV
jgi:biopolymer transport protein ExbB/TolQ